MTWADFWNALMEIHAVPTAGLSLLIIGAIFRWYEPLARFLGYSRETLKEAWWIKARPSEGIENQGRVEDHLRRLSRYGQAMMVVGVVLFLLSALLP